MDRTITVIRTCKVPFETIADQLATDPARVLQPATNAATAVTNDIVLTLDSKWAWFDIHEDVHVQVGELSRGRTTELPLSWHADEHKRLLPAVDGHLSLYPLSSAYTEITYAGHYTPPSGLFSSIGERLAGRRVIEATIGHMLDEIVAHLEQQNPTPAAIH